MTSERASERAVFSVSALLFAASAAVTIVWCAAMSAMGEMEMSGGWTMSMMWMRMPGQTWLGRGVVPRHVDCDDGGDDPYRARMRSITIAPHVRCWPVADVPSAAFVRP